MTIIFATKSRTTAVLTFRYDPGVVAVVRSVPDRYWNPRAKEWRIGLRYLEGTCRHLVELGHDVILDGVEWTADPKAANGTDPLVNLFDVVPAHLRDAVYKSLARALHPDVGGDGRLMQQLNDAFRRER